MNKIALIIPTINEAWLGGINYYCNLLTQCQRYESQSLEITVITSPDSVQRIKEIFPDPTEVLATLLTQKFSFSWIIRNTIYVITGKDYLMERFLTKNQFTIVTHSACRNYGSKLHQIGWIPDLQHKYFPDFFSHNEIRRRDRDFQRMLDLCDLVIVSSKVALNDVVHFYNAPKEKLVVMHFYKRICLASNKVCKEQLQNKYQLPERFFFLPNQFWKHKNHSIVIKALNILKLNGQQITVVCSGNTKDYRNPDYFEELMAQVHDLELNEYFKVLGLIPMEEVNELIKHAIALINPSLFEGWSTTVEEARAYGKRIILSDIPVHREQFPPDALFFTADSAEELAACIEEVIETYSEVGEITRKQTAQISAEQLCSDFAQTYKEIVNSIV